MGLAAMSVGQTDADTLPPPPRKAVMRIRSDLAMGQAGRQSGRQAGRRGGRQGKKIILSRMATSLCVLAISRENHPSASVRS